MSLSVIESPIPHMPRLNERAPDFEALSTHGAVKLADYHGRWLLFFSHPGDFTPVCTSEFVALAQRHKEFEALNCDLLGLSVDSRYSHLAWIENIREKFQVEVDFPIIEDIGMSVASSYGMVHSRSNTTAPIRATFLIDPKSILKAMVYYPQNVGRSVDELLRLLRALQTADNYGVAVPEGWQPGKQVLVPAPDTMEEFKSRPEKLECVDWYYCKRPLAKDRDTA